MNCGINEGIKWGHTIDRSPEGYAFRAWDWYTGKTIIYGMYYYHSVDAAMVAMIAQMVELGYDRNEMR